MTFEEKCRLVRIHSALDAELGDSDPMDDITDDEMREQYPGVWAAGQIADMIGPGPWDKYRKPNRPGPSEGNVLSRAITESAQAIIETYAYLTDEIPQSQVEMVLCENMQQVDIDLEWYRSQFEHVPLEETIMLCNECGQEIGTHPVCSYCRAAKEREKGKEI